MPSRGESVREGVEIHPSAIVSDRADLAQGVVIGPGCVIDGPVRLGEGVRVLGAAYLVGPLSIGPGTTIYPFACLGTPAQDYKVKPGDPTPGVVIGAGCIIREHVTVHAATRPDAPTTIGDRVFMMVGSHAGHDARVGNDVVLVNGAQLAGHTTVGERANVSAHVLVHQFGRIGRLAMASGNATLAADLPPFCIGADRNLMHGLNVVGMRRSGLARDDITLLRAAYREVLHEKRSRADVIEGLERFAPGHPLIAEWIEFYRTTRRSVCLSASLPPRHLRGWLRRLDELPEGPDEGEGDDAL
ncbi:MAG: acyl-ACP--UDP-N-acetylglucosamine O-acyltransferase [Phycisphaerales bacterium]|nr:acyl-ACP--UDP-N-acetylglucosamine O-acyltransferase [Phycisphaerales bacterium]